MRKKKFVGVDFDKTLATHKAGQKSLGQPLKPMVARVKRLLSQGEDVKVFTARPKSAHPAIRKWTKEHIGKTLSVTNTKQHNMTKFYDDRAVAIKPNNGRVKKTK